MATITCGSLTVSGLFEDVLDSAPEVQQKRTHFFGIRGVSVLSGGVGGREIEIPCWIFNSYETHNAIVAKLNELAAYAGQITGSLVIPSTAGVSRSFPDCIYMGFEKSPRGIIYDAANSLGEGAGMYFCQGRLKFYQHLISLRG